MLACDTSKSFKVTFWRDQYAGGASYRLDHHRSNRLRAMQSDYVFQPVCQIEVLRLESALEARSFSMRMRQVIHAPYLS